MPQTSYSLDIDTAYAGQVVEIGRLAGKFEASEDIPPGRLCELHTDGKLRLFRGGKKVGFSIYRSAKDPGAYVSGDMVPCLRSGLIWADFSGTAASAAVLAGISVKGASTTATDRGKVTQLAPVGTSDAEVYDGGPCKFYGTPTGNSGLALVEVDLPAEDDARPQNTPVLLSQTANDYAVTPIVHGQVYEINTSAANSTVSLPTAAANGTVLHFVADGTKNGHTLTFRDVTTAISAATTASKRVAATAIKAGGAWAVNLTVGP